MNYQSRSSEQQSLKGLIEDGIPQLPCGPVKARQKQYSESATWQRQGLSGYGMFVGRDFPNIVLCLVV